MYYKNIKEPVSNFLRVVDYKSLFSNVKSNHDFIKYPVVKALTSYGFYWFKERKILLRRNVKVFRIVKEFQGPIHTDFYNKKGTEFAFNFVYEGNGEMQWVEDINGEVLFVNNKDDVYPVYTNVTSCNIIEKWNGSAALVKTDTFHRIVTQNEERYCLSFRTVFGTFPETFEEAAELI